MTVMDTIRARHSVREYTDRPIEGEVCQQLNAVVEECRRDSGLNIQFVTGNPEAFNVVKSFGLIHGCGNHVAFVVHGKTSEFDEAIGYWGQKIVLRAQELGLNTCWVALCARRKCKVQLAEGERVRIVIAVGYGENNGHDRSTKTLEQLATVQCTEMPAWFEIAMEATQLAPTAMNNQHFHITLREDGRTVAFDAPQGRLDVIDAGIVKYHFEVAANEMGADWRWE